MLRIRYDKTNPEMHISRTIPVVLPKSIIDELKSSGLLVEFVVDVVIIINIPANTYELAALDKKKNVGVFYIGEGTNSDNKLWRERYLKEKAKKELSKLGINFHKEKRK